MQDVRTSLRQLIGTLVLGTDNSSRLVLHLFGALVSQYLSTWYGPIPFIVGTWYKPPNDTNITVPGCTFTELEQATNSELNNIYSWLKANKLSLGIVKTEFMAISTRQKFLAEN